MKTRLFPARRLRLHSAQLQRQLTFILGGIVVGAAAVALALLAEMADAQFQRIVRWWPYAPLVITPFGIALSAYLTKRVFPNSQGSGIPQAIAARHLHDQKSRGRLVSIWIAVGKFFLTLFGLFCGASIGREGPTVQVGASIMFAIGRLSPRRQSGLILVGSSAGIAAAFNTPLAGIVFAIEEMSRSFEVQTTGLLIVAIVVAGMTSLGLLGDYTYFGTTSVAMHGLAGWLTVPVCGIVGGLLGGLFSRILVEFGRGLPGRVGGAIKRHPIAFAFVCGLVTAICGMLSGNSVFGSGYGHVKALIDHGVALPESFGLLKFIVTTAASISGIAGGLFSPSLAVGAGIGFNIAAFFPHIPLNIVILLGMVAYFSGVVQAPITATVIVTEMTNDHAMVLPLMAASFIAYGFSRLVCHEGVYHALSKNFIAAQHTLEAAEHTTTHA